MRLCFSILVKVALTVIKGLAPLEVPLILETGRLPENESSQQENLRGGQRNDWHDVTAEGGHSVSISTEAELQDLLCKNSADLQHNFFF